MPSKPRLFIPTLYFAEGLPFTIVNKVSVVLLKTLAMSNELNALYTSLLYIPWTFKLFWAPLVDLYGTRRGWIIYTQIALAIMSVLLAMALYLPNCTYVLLVIFAVIAFTSATQDIAIDGYYLDVLKPEQQAFYVGIRSSAYKVAWLFGTGGLVTLAGVLAEKLRLPNSLYLGWSCAFITCAVLFGGLALFHLARLPLADRNSRAWEGDHALKGGISLEQDETSNLGSAFVTIFLDFLDQPRIAVIILYVLIFRLGDALLMKMAPPFLLDSVGKGGLGLSTAAVGLIDGTIGTTFLLAGGIIGGGLISKYGLKKFIMPFAIIQNSSLLLYWFLALHKPNYYLVGCVDAFEQFSYGLGTAAYTVLLISTVKERYKAAQYAIVTAFMALGVMLPGMASGYLAKSMGYANFFLLSFIVSLPGILTISFLPIKEILPKSEIARQC